MRPYMLRHAPDHLKTQKMCDKVIKIEPFLLGCIPDRYKTQETLENAIEKKKLIESKVCC